MNIKQRPSLLFLTNLYHDAPEEDIFLTKHLRDTFDICIAHPLDCEHIEDAFDIALIRNIWPSHDYEQQKTGLIRRLTNKGLMPASSAEQGYFDKENYLEKEYLADLFKRGYPVIPSIDTIKHIEKLGEYTEYFFKPLNQCDGKGSFRVKKNQIHDLDITDAILQPYIEFDYEVCFYFIDGTFVYAFSISNRLTGNDYKIYTPTKKDLDFAQKFIDWNNLEFGLERVDAVRVSATQELLLTELEDFGPYLYLLELPHSIHEKVITALKNSLLKRLKDIQ